MLVALTAGAQKQNTHNGQIARNLELFDDIYRQLDIFYVDSLNPDTVLYWGIQKMLAKVDPFTEYYSSADMGDFKTLSTGKYGGMGSAIRYLSNIKRTVVSEPYEDSPAHEAGLIAGDIIMSIDGRDTKDWTITEVSERLRGEAGTTFELVVQRPGEAKTRKMLITRRTIQQPQVPYYGLVRPGVGYIFLTGFTEGAAREVRFALTDLKKQGATSLVLDLRGNGGGSVSEAVDIVSMVVPKGNKVVYTKGKMASASREYYTSADPIDSLMPMAVLVDGGSASSSEIVAGALQDLDRATIVGTRTYGKGFVQSMRDVSGGGLLKLTTGRYYIPSGRCVQAYDYRHLNEDGSVGMVPDSLTRVFYTAAGRPVRDGGGITPDILMPSDTLATIVYDFVASDAFFDYATHYVAQHPTVAPAGEITLSDADYDDFIDFMTKAKFKYNNRSLEVFDFLKTMAKREGYYDEAKAEFDALESKFASDLASDLRRNRKDIETYICDELAHRYYLQRGGVKQTLRDDPTLEAAIKAINCEQLTMNN